MRSDFLLKSAALIGVFIALGVVYTFSTKGHLSLNFNLPEAQKSGFIIPPTPAATPTSTPIPTPTPEPLIGFCLKVPVLMYHHIEPAEEAASKGHINLNVNAEIVDSQMKYLADSGYKTVSAEDLVNALLNKQQLEKTVVVTLDDGYDDNYFFAYPIAKKYNIILNMMIPTGLVNNAGYVTWDQLKEMTQSGSVYVYNHTWSHYNSGGGNQEKIEWEIVTAKQQLESSLGKPVKIFAYPYGFSGIYVINTLMREGFTGAYSTNPGQWQCDSFIYRLHRQRIGNTALSYYGYNR